MPKLELPEEISRRYREMSHSLGPPCITQHNKSKASSSSPLRLVPQTIMQNCVFVIRWYNHQWLYWGPDNLGIKLRYDMLCLWITFHYWLHQQYSTQLYQIQCQVAHFLINRTENKAA